MDVCDLQYQPEDDVSDATAPEENRVRQDGIPPTTVLSDGTVVMQGIEFDWDTLRKSVSAHAEAHAEAHHFLINVVELDVITLQIKCQRAGAQIT